MKNFAVPLLHVPFGLPHFLVLGAALFCLGLYGALVNRNAVRVLMCVELMLNAVNINFVAFANYVGPPTLRGQFVALFVITVAAAEAAVGLAIVLLLHRHVQSVDLERFDALKW